MSPPNHSTRGPLVPTSGVEVAFKEITGYMQKANLWLHSMPPSPASRHLTCVQNIYLRNTETLKLRH